MIFSKARPAGARCRELIRTLEDYWFDRTRSVRTSEVAELQNFRLAGERRDAFMYLPVRVKNARAALRALPVADHESFTFIDLGSGAGRVLFLAAEYPFRRIEGVELATELHERAEENILRFRPRRQRCHQIVPINMSAADYEFPRENLAIFMFNPFGPDVLSDVVTHLSASLVAHPRKVIVAMLYPEFGYVMDRSRELQLFLETKKYRIYKSAY